MSSRKYSKYEYELLQEEASRKRREAIKERQARRKKEKEERKKRDEEREAKRKKEEEEREAKRKKEEEEREARWKKEEEEREAKRKKEEEERKKRDEEFNNCIKKFLNSYSIYKYFYEEDVSNDDLEAFVTFARMSQPYLNKLIPHVKNDQQHISLPFARYIFNTHEYKDGYVLYKNNKQAFEEAIQKHPNNFAENDSEWHAWDDAARSHMNKMFEKAGTDAKIEVLKMHNKRLKKEAKELSTRTLTQDLVKEYNSEKTLKYEPMKESVKEQRRETKRQETQQYPPRFTTSKPQPIVDITTTHKPRLNLSHIQQVHQPGQVLPSENTRARRRGQIDGLEEDKRIWNSEKDLYVKAWERIGDGISKLPQRTGIHATNDVRAAVKGLKYGKAIGNRLCGWR